MLVLGTRAMLCSTPCSPPAPPSAVPAAPPPVLPLPSAPAAASAFVHMPLPPVGQLWLLLLAGQPLPLPWPQHQQQPTQHSSAWSATACQAHGEQHPPPSNLSSRSCRGVLHETVHTEVVSIALGIAVAEQAVLVLAAYILQQCMLQELYATWLGFVGVFCIYIRQLHTQTLAHHRQGNGVDALHHAVCCLPLQQATAQHMQTRASERLQQEVQRSH